MKKKLIPIWFFLGIERRFSRDIKSYYCCACGGRCEVSFPLRKKLPKKIACKNQKKQAEIFLVKNNFISYCKKDD